MKVDGRQTRNIASYRPTTTLPTTVVEHHRIQTIITSRSPPYQRIRVFLRMVHVQRRNAHAVKRHESQQKVALEHHQQDQATASPVHHLQLKTPWKQDIITLRIRIESEISPTTSSLHSRHCAGVRMQTTADSITVSIPDEGRVA